MSIPFPLLPLSSLYFLPFLPFSLRPFPGCGPRRGPSRDPVRESLVGPGRSEPGRQTIYDAFENHAIPMIAHLQALSSVLARRRTYQYGFSEKRSGGMVAYRPILTHLALCIDVYITLLYSSQKLCYTAQLTAGPHTLLRKGSDLIQFDMERCRFIQRKIGSKIVRVMANYPSSTVPNTTF